jgi:hypothetical protein
VEVHVHDVEAHVGVVEARVHDGKAHAHVGEVLENDVLALAKHGSA